MVTSRLIKISKITALISFLCGTIIFLLYYQTSSSGLLFFGYGYIAIVGLINIGLLIWLITKLISDKENRKRISITIALMLLNIPIMIVYCWISLILLGVMRISLSNTTGYELTGIKIFGCEPKLIDEMEPGDNKTIWVGITGDCTINIEYELNGQMRTETVAGYVTSGMGQKMNYKIGGKNNNDL
jgi:hypothetical protein